MRKLIFLFLIGLLFLIETLEVNSEKQVFTICIDPGHGSLDGGSSANNVLEKDINLAIALLLEEELVSLGYRVILTRKTDETVIPFNKKRDLNQRIEIINCSNADLFLSIHCNSFPNNKYYGAQTFYYTKQNEYLAYLIQNELKRLTMTTRYHKEITDIYLLKNVVVAGVLIECGFISNEEEALKLATKEYQIVIAKAISYGVSHYLELL